LPFGASDGCPRTRGSLLSRRLSAADEPREVPTTARRTSFRSFLTVALAAGLLGLSPALADTQQELDQAKRELADVQAELHRATAAWHSAIVSLEATRVQIAETRERIGDLELRLDRIDARLATRAVAAFTNGPASTIDLLLSSSSLTEFSDRLEFLGSVAQDDVDLAIEQQVTQGELRRQHEDLQALSERQSEAAAELNEARERIDARFREIDERVDELADEVRQETAALNILGQTPNPDGVIQRCPVAGPNSFVDSFGWPRSDGRVHEGIDLIAPYGTPIVASHAGTVSQSSSYLGGLQAYVRTSGGTFTFYAHLSSFGNTGSVSVGTVIGYVGSTGNAGSTNHLHFEYHPGGGAAVNPYQMLLAVC
jgi:murein DD-endopeptidase MepM/ murein hydrolase activator NlpD